MKKILYSLIILFTVLAISVSCDESVHKHDFQPVHEKDSAPSCFAYGYNYYECLCGEIKIEPVAKIAHQYIEEVADCLLKSAATCTEAAVYYKSCLLCGAKGTETFTVEALGHNLVHHEAQAATCTTIGWNAYDTCSRCDYTTYVEIAALGHNYGSDRRCSTCYAIKPYEIGETGPAGGLVFYDCDADNNNGNADGLVSSECGWRYLEAAPNDITVDSKMFFPFGFYRTSSDGSNLYVNGMDFYDINTCTRTEIGTGKSNTEKLVAAMGNAAYRYRSGSSTISNYAAKLCADYTYGGYVDWFLPSKDELNLMSTNLYKKGLGSFAHDRYNYYWSSSENLVSNYTAIFVWQETIGFDRYSYGRDEEARVRAIRAF